jgi:hypothetical protein
LPRREVKGPTQRGLAHKATSPPIKSLDIIIFYDNLLGMNFSVREYLTAEGSCPYRDWLETVDISVKARIQARVLRFEMGNLGDHKAIGEGVWEARLALGPGYRVYFGKD